MKLAFTTLGSPDWSFDKTLEEAERLGFEAIEIRGVEGKMLADEIEAFFPEKQAETERKLSDRKIKICGFGSSVKFHDFDKYDEAVREGRNAVDVCSRMGIPFVRVFGDRVESPEARDAVIENAVRGIRELCAYARGKGVKVILEVHGDFNTIENVAGVAKGLTDCPEFGILWDIEHSDKIYEDGWLRFYQAIKPLIYHVHVKDHIRGNGAFQLCLVGEGDIPIRDIIHTLEKDGYGGYLSLEWEKKWHPELPEPEIAYPGYVKFMKSL